MLLGTLRALEMVLYPCPDQCLATVLLLGSIVSPLDFIVGFFVLTCGVSCGTLQFVSLSVSSKLTGGLTHTSTIELNK